MPCARRQKGTGRRGCGRESSSDSGPRERPAFVSHARRTVARKAIHCKDAGGDVPPCTIDGSHPVKDHGTRSVAWGFNVLAVELIESDAQFDGMRAVWEDLQARSAPDNPFLTFEWVRSWYRHLRAGRRLALSILRDETGVRAIVPWCIGYAWGGRLPFRTIQFLGTGLSDRLDLLTTADPAEVLTATLRHLQEKSIGWDMIDLREVPSDSPTVAAAGAVSARLGMECEIDEDSTCPYLSIESDWEKFFASRVGAETRGKMRRKVRRIQEQGARLSILEAMPEGSPLLGRLAAVPQDGAYLGHRRISIFSTAAKREFFEEIVARFSERGWL